MYQVRVNSQQESSYRNKESTCRSTRQLPVENVPERPLQGRRVVRDDLAGDERVGLHDDAVVGVTGQGNACKKINNIDKSYRTMRMSALVASPRPPYVHALSRRLPY